MRKVLTHTHFAMPIGHQCLGQRRIKDIFMVILKQQFPLLAQSQGTSFLSTMRLRVLSSNDKKFSDIVLQFKIFSQTFISLFLELSVQLGIFPVIYFKCPIGVIYLFSVLDMKATIQV